MNAATAQPPISSFQLRTDAGGTPLMLACRALASLTLAACVGACANINSQTNAYATIDEARKAGAVEQGLVPEWLPPGSHDIREAHVPGTTSLWGIVNFPREEGDALRAALIPEEVPLDGMDVHMPGRIEWWPIELRGALNGERLGIVGIKGYRARHNGLFLAVNWEQGRAYYWSTQ